MKRRAALLLSAVMLVASSGYAVGQIIPARTYTKKRIVIQNIHRCKPGRTTLVGRGNWDPIKKKHPRYVCRPR